MSFGDWELFRMVVISLREQELSTFSTHDEGPRSVRFTVGSDQLRKGTTLLTRTVEIFTL